MTRLGRHALVAVVALGSACSGNLPAPPFADGDHAGEEPQIVLSWPPPGPVEIVPPPPPELKRPIWLDGEWLWNGRRWIWQDHGWQDAPAGQVYELPTTTRLPDGRIVHFPGKWRPKAP